MDELGSIGRALATPQFIFSIIIGLVMIAGGMVLLFGYKPIQPPTTQTHLPGMPSDSTSSQTSAATIGGIILIIIGCIIPFAGWWRRKLIKSNPGIAATVGFLDVASMLKFLF
jgi:hypothetical protein